MKNKRRRILMVSCSVILLCVCIIAGMSYALFSDTVSATTHLKAGELDISLVRTGLSYSVLGADGKPTYGSNSDRVDLTNPNSGNAFGLWDGVVIVPTSYFEGTFEIAKSAGTNVAFNYSVTMRLNGTSNALAEQLIVTITKPDGTTIEKKLSQMANGVEIAVGEMDNNTTARQTFKVRVDFANLANSVNNTAQEQTVNFDLLVNAVQWTPETPSIANLIR